jgi:hypothetical protein
MTSQGSRPLRPRGSFTGVVAVIMGSIRFHCSFVSSILIILHIQDVMSRFIFILLFQLIIASSHASKRLSFF